MRVIVTGVCGFIGSVFALRAVERGHQVLGLDNMDNGLNNRRLRDNDAITIGTWDCAKGLSDINSIAADVIAHFAPVDVAPVLEDAKKLTAAWMLVPVEHMGDHVRVHQQSDDKNKPMVVPLKFYSVIGAYKGLTERRISGLPVVPALVRAYQSWTYDYLPFVINGNDWDTRDGTPARDFINVLDVVDHLLDLVEGKIESYIMPDGAVHFGTGRTTTVQELADIFRQWKGQVHTQIGPRRAGDVGLVRCPREPVIELTRWRMLTPAWVSIRDEIEALLG